MWKITCDEKSATKLMDIPRAIPPQAEIQQLMQGIRSRYIRSFLRIILTHTSANEKEIDNQRTALGSASAPLGWTHKSNVWTVKL